MRDARRTVSPLAFIRIVPVLITVTACATALPNTINVSMAELIMDPAPYVGQTISVKGYFKRHANLRLFLTDDHARILDFESSILLSDTDKGDLHRLDCLEKYVKLVGTIAAHTPSSYAIVHIQRIDNLDSGEVCWQL